MSALDPRFLDAGLIALAEQSTAIWACSSNPGLDWPRATQVYGLAVKNNVTFSAVQADDGTGRRIAVQPFTDGRWVASGAAGFWALVDGNSERVLASGIIDPPKSGLTGQALTLSAPLYITLPGVAPDPVV